MSQPFSHRRPIKGRIRAPVKKPDAQFDNTWERLSEAIKTIHQQRSHTLSYEEVYRCAYNMVIHKCGERLYFGVKGLVEQHLEDMANNDIVPVLGLAETSPNEGVQVLKVVQKVWKHHTTCMDMISAILIHMDKNYVPQHRVPGTYDLGLDLFRDKIIRSPAHPIQSQLQTVLLGQITRERKGDIIDRGAIKACVDMLLELQDDQTHATVYKTDFELLFVETSREFYRVESDEMIRTSDSPEYLRKVEMRLREEEERCQHYLSSRTEAKLRNIVEQEMIGRHVKTILEMENSGLQQMLMQDRIEDLARLYKLFALVPTGFDELKKGTSLFITGRGKDINGNVSADAAGAAGSSKGTGASVSMALQWVEDVLGLRDKLNAVLFLAFNRDKKFENSFNSAFEEFINANVKAPEFLSLFIDDYLKKGIKGESEDDTQAVLNKTTTVFRFLSDKDIFERYYKQHLANRLLHKRSVSDDAERGMISKLKTECGYQFTSKLEGMFTDMRVSNDTMNVFKEFHETAVERAPCELSVTVLTSTFWPFSSTPVPCILPVDLQTATKVFERFYITRHNGRKLTWHCSMGTVDLRANFSTKKHELNVSTMASIILLLFNEAAEGEELSYSAIQAGTGLPEDQLKRTLQSVACGKFKILIKSPKSRDVANTDMFSFNATFTSPMARIKILTIASRVENDTEVKATHEKVEDARNHMAEAAIVRVMKNRKTLEHNNLVAEVTTQLQARFQPSPAMIKKRIEALIDREYLERSADRKTYNYLA